jgi:hypothetical protein
MTTIPQSQDPIDWEVDKNKIPKTLNTLSILSFIGCGFGIIGLVVNLFKKTPTETDFLEMQDKYDKAPDFVKSIMGAHGVEMARKTTENNFSISLLSIIAIALCLYGILRMRALKKEGFYIYVIGELVVPMLTIGIFVGFGLYGGFVLAMSILIPILFIILYAGQLKRLS